MRILLVEDESHLAEALVQILHKNNYTVDLSSDGESGLDNALSNIYDLILLDIMLPKMDGLTVLKSLRSQNIKTPVLMLTAKGEISDKVISLDSGADDYLPKPFATEELLARIRAMSRRKGEVLSDNLLKFGDVALNTATLKLSASSKEVKLTLKESELLPMEAIIFENNISLDYNIEPKVSILGNDQQIIQVIMILLDNAIKYTQPKGSITIALERQHNTALLSVTNTGDGISTQDLDKIFDRFCRTDKSRSRSQGGYGLGLAIAQTILDHHNGKITVKSMLNESTTFYVELPCINN